MNQIQIITKDIQLNFYTNQIEATQSSCIIWRSCNQSNIIIIERYRMDIQESDWTIEMKSVKSYGYWIIIQYIIEVKRGF